jgi:hypothetical protein
MSTFTSAFSFALDFGIDFNFAAGFDFKVGFTFCFVFGFVVLVVSFCFFACFGLAGIAWLSFCFFNLIFAVAVFCVGFVFVIAVFGFLLVGVMVSVVASLFQHWVHMGIFSELICRYRVMFVFLQFGFSGFWHRSSKLTQPTYYMFGSLKKVAIIQGREVSTG